MTQTTPTSDVSQANFNHLVMDIVWFGVAFPSVTRFLSIYAIRLGASATLLGLIAAVPSIFALVSSSFAVWWRKKYANSVRAQLWPGVGFRLLFFLPALTPLFPRDFQPYWLLISVTAPAIPQGISSVLFLVLLREGTENSVLTRLMSRRSMMFNVAVGISTLATGFWLEFVGFPGNYVSMFLFGFAMSMISLWHVQQVVPMTSEMPKSHPAFDLKPWRISSFQRMAFVTTVAYVAFFFIIPIIPLRLVDEMGADEAFMSIFSLAELSMAAIVSLFLSRIMDRFGNLRTISASMVVTGLSGIVLVVSPSLPLTLLSAALSGLSWTVASISIFAYFSETTSPENVTHYSQLYNQIVMIAVFIGPMLGSQLASTSLSLTTVILIGSLLRLAAGGLIPLHLFGRKEAAPGRAE